MCLLVVGDIHEVVVVVWAVAGIHEVLLGEVHESALVEDILEMLELNVVSDSC